jgi:hypothetical protein
MGVLLGSARRASALSRQVVPKPLAILCSQTIAFQQRVQHQSCNIVGGAIIRLVGAVLLEANDEWQLQHRYIQTEVMTELTPTLIEAEPMGISTVAA